MGRINVLEEAVANRIAAGEVVERPASVVKELVENALDAGARRIGVDLVEGGRKLIRVADDGCGMDADDAVLALQRFATSKIADAEDLLHILTMGFRGEALPSIAAVSRLRLRTRPHDADEGTEVEVAGGEMTDVRPYGGPPGTTVEVADLFYNTPARLKFLRAANAERGHCVDWVQRLALAYPETAFRVTHDGGTVFVAPATGDMLPVLALMYGNVSTRDFVPVHYESPDIRLDGYISSPRLTRSTRVHQHFFVNRRFVRSRAMSHAVTTAYGGLLPTGRAPICAVRIDIAPGFVDPNVHPTKIDVRFSRPWEIHHLIEQAVVEALRAAKLIGEASAPRAPLGELRLGEGPSWSRPSPFADQIDEHDEGIEVHADALEALGAAAGASPGLPLAPQAEPGLGQARVLGQMRNTYIVAETSEGLVLINQHRASERVLANRMTEGTEGRVARSQRLTVPVSVELAPAEAGAVESALDLFVELGFEVEPFGRSAWLIRGIPAFLEGRNYEEAFRGLAEELAGEDVPPGLDQRRGLAVAVAACRAAVKAGEKLQPGEMEALVRALAETNTPGLCPHGQPVILALPFGDLDRRFERPPRRRQ
jgi:DNA mismatch repair protein MutL